jgi:NAD(P)-dependent dehydrogenase (short-subunit alcohol dehydrogenase family)
MPNAKRKILVTGSSGQIGSELVAALQARHGTQNVVACDSKPLEVDGGLFELADVTDRETLQGIIRKHRIGSIYHLVSILSAAGEKNPDRLACQYREPPERAGSCHTGENGQCLLAEFDRGIRAAYASNPHAPAHRHGPQYHVRHHQSDGRASL